ncbi:ATP-binding protein [Nocardia concava]|uniref:ATP-binding protein n=1 Tax=Nocardia concava TaxID=257281 RepID=UPI000594B905|nr:LuxR family transcriptional regulator [Nocardia concava]
MPTGSAVFVGRARELERIAELLAGPARLVTLVGAGGIGKTCLALRATGRLREADGPPVHWVRLARLPKDTNSDAVLDEIAAAVLDGDFSGRTARRALIDELARTPRCVLVLDNCEHVLDGVGEVIADLLAAVPGLAVLATSRTPIGWVDEHIVTIPPLSNQQALELFRRRAELAGHPIADSDTELVAEICWHLHNFPLYIRLAAARLRYQSPPMILHDLGGDADRRLRWSPGFRVGADDRHRDINAVIGWSYELCEPKERLLFARLSVFAVGYDVNPEDAEPDRLAVPDIGADLTAIEEICADPGPDGLAREEIAQLLEQLVDHSMVSIRVGIETARYALLESFQLFARERLRENGSGEPARMATAHRRYYRDLVVEVATGWVSPREQELLTRARTEWDNIVAAIESGLSDPDAVVVSLEIALGLLASRAPFLRGSLRESRGLVERALAAAKALGRCPLDLEVSAKALIGWLVLCQGQSAEADRLLEECVAASTGDHTDWRADPTTDLGLPAPVEYLWGGILWLVHAHPRATTVLARARTKFTTTGDRGGATMSELFEALSAAFHAPADEASTVTRGFLDAMLEAGPQSATSWARYARAIAISAHADPAEGLAFCDKGLAWQIPMRDNWGVVWGLNIRAWILSRLITERLASDDTAAAWAQGIARSLGTAAAIRRRLGIELENLRPFAEHTAEAVAVASKVLGPKAFNAAVEEVEFAPGADRLPSACPEAVECLAEQTNPPALARQSQPWNELTSAELQVATLAATGLTNTAIAAHRGTSTRTVDAQIAAVLSKLMINSRKDIATKLPQLDSARRNSAGD